MNNKKIEDRIIVALDIQTKENLDFLISELKGAATFVKVGMELFYSFGPSIISELKKNGFKVFLDLKIHDIPNTAKHTCKSITKLGADIINVHASGGLKMMKASLEGVNEALLEKPELNRPIVIAVTQLTSSDQEMIKNDLLIPNPINEIVVHYAKRAKEAGLDGVVSSPHEVELIKKSIDNNFICVTPGIRPEQSSLGDQKRVMTPKEALKNGSDYIVIGRAITKSKSPKATFLKILKEVKNNS